MPLRALHRQVAAIALRAAAEPGSPWAAATA